MLQHQNTLKTKNYFKLFELPFEILIIDLDK